MNTRQAEGDESAKSPGRRSSAATTTFNLSQGPGGEQQPPDLANDRYELFREIAQGGMGTIFQAHDRQLRREVAIKVLRAEYAGNSSAVEAFANEAYIMGVLSHPGVTPVYECGSCADGRPYHVMKLVNGVTLASMLQVDASNQGETIKIFADVCETLAFAHSCEILHLDLKPANIMVGAFGEVHVMDWGLACPQDQAHVEGAKGSGPVHGTPEYMAPEQAKGKSLTTQTDVFGLGAILCEILIGRTPYVGDSVQQVFRRAARGSLGEAMALLDASTAEPALVRLAKKCLAIDPCDRPRDAMVLARQVAHYQESALQVAKSDMGRFFELSLDLFCIADLDGYFRRINANFSRLLGFSTDDLLAQPFMAFVHPDDHERTLQQMAALTGGQPVVRFRNRYRSASGEFKVLEWTAKAIHDEGIVFAVARDVTGKLPPLPQDSPAGDA